MMTLRDRLEETDLSPPGGRRSTRCVQSGPCTIRLCGRRQHLFVEQLMKLRLERAREILSDPRQAAPRIEDVATRCGFTDPSHFLHAASGRSTAHAPLRYRRAVL